MLSTSTKPETARNKLSDYAITLHGLSFASCTVVNDPGVITDPI